MNRFMPVLLSAPRSSPSAGRDFLTKKSMALMIGQQAVNLLLTSSSKGTTRKELTHLSSELSDVKARTRS